MYFELSPLIVCIAFCIVNTYSEFQVNIFCNIEDITKCQSFCTTKPPPPMTTPRLQQYLEFSPKTAELKRGTTVSKLRWFPGLVQWIPYLIKNEMSKFEVNNLQKSFPKQALGLRVCSTSLLKTLWENEKFDSNFSFTNSVFYPHGELSAIFIIFKIVICKFFQFGSI